MKKFLEIFEESKTTGMLICVYDYGRKDDKFWLGTVHSYNDKLVALNLFGLHGIYDGMIILEVEDIESIEHKDDYSVAYQYLLETTKAEKSILQFTLPLSKNWQYDLLKSLSHNPVFLSIGVDIDAAVFGKLESFDDEGITLVPVHKLGETNGFVTYKWEDVTDIHFNRAEDLKRQKLYEWRQNKK